MLKSFRSGINSIALGLVVAASTLVGTASADPRDFEFVNLDGSTSIVAAWMAPAGTPDPWTQITLSGSIGPRSTTPVDVTGGTGCMYDLKVQLSSGDLQYFNDVNLCSTLHLIVT